MTTCLICHTELALTLQFSDIFLSRLPKSSICPDCHAQFELITEQHCQICYKPEIDGLCSDCLEVSDPTPHQAIFHYNDFAKAYFHAYKFQGDFRLRSAFDKALTRALKHRTLVPIPVSPERLQERGFNQVTGFLTSAKLTYLDILLKKETQHQSHRNRSERLSSDNPFSLKTDSILPDKITIIDDIYTTGTTLHHAVRLIKNAGCTHVSTFSLFR